MLRFSVVISVFNKANFLANTLASVLAQSYTNFEVIILNDGSTDQSENIIQPFLSDSRIRYYSEENKGAAAGRNYVIQKATAPYIALLDADDIWKPNYLEEQHRLIEKYPNEMVFATNSEVISKEKILQRAYSVVINDREDVIVDYFKASYLDSILHSSTTVIKKEAFDEVGLYNPKIRSGQDTDLYVRLGLKYPVVFSPKICVQYLNIENSLFRSSKKLSHKPTFEDYEQFEEGNYGLKKFLDLNRYSLCIIAKLEGNKEGFKKLYEKIDLTNLNKKQRFLLRQNHKILKQFLKLKNSITKLGIKLSVFK
ncbi:MAG: glycosyltransferase family 2 protein [Flavobacteriaceae bacterium]|nr:glycosyltransferase family 2 protein [Flavobacteriaceae bacterium]